MRSARPVRRRPRRHVLPAVASLVDQATADQDGHLLVHVDGPVHPEVALGIKPIGEHPFQVLAGFTAPSSWTAFGVRACGRAHHLDDPQAPPQPTAMTFLVDRHGGEASVMRLADRVEALDGPAEGTIPDLCRRVLGLPTARAPRSTALLWTCMWLDRLLEEWGQPDRRRELVSSWEQLAARHPAIDPPVDVGALTEPAALVGAARAHAASMTWTDLRHAPQPLVFPDGQLDPAVARWMDDGFFARWAIGAYPSPHTMALDLRDLLGEPLGPRLLQVVVGVLT